MIPHFSPFFLSPYFFFGNFIEAYRQLHGEGLVLDVEYTCMMWALHIRSH